MAPAGPNQTRMAAQLPLPFGEVSVCERLCKSLCPGLPQILLFCLLAFVERPLL